MIADHGRATTMCRLLSLHISGPPVEHNLLVFLSCVCVCLIWARVNNRDRSHHHFDISTRGIFNPNELVVHLSHLYSPRCLLPFHICKACPRNQGWKKTRSRLLRGKCTRQSWMTSGGKERSVAHTERVTTTQKCRQHPL